MAKYLSAIVFVLCLVAVSYTVSAAQPQQMSHDGTVVSAGSGKLEMTSDDGKAHTHTIDANVQVVVNGKPGKLEDLKKGTKIHVTTGPDGKVTAVSTIEKK